MENPTRVVGVCFDDAGCQTSGRRDGMSLELKLKPLTADFRGLRFFTACMVVFLNPAYSQQDSSGKPIAIGWVQAAGEIFIYARKSDLGNLYDGSCISGVMALFRSKYATRCGLFPDHAYLHD